MKGKIIFTIILGVSLFLPFAFGIDSSLWTQSIAIAFTLGFFYELIIDIKHKNMYCYILFIISGFSLVKSSFTFTFQEFLFVIVFAILVDSLQNLIGFNLSKSNNKYLLLINYKYPKAINERKSITASILSILIAGLIVIFLEFNFYLTEVIFTALSSFVFIIVFLLIAIFSVFGDLIYSILKRILGIEDYFPTLATFGGICDRADSWSFAFIPLLIIYQFFV